MSDLKPGWRRVRFGDVVRQVKNRVDAATSGLERYVAGEHMDTDDMRVRRWGTIGDGDLGPAFHMRFRPGQVLYGSRRTYLRKVAVTDFEGICANTTFVLESADPQVLLPELLPFVMQTEAFHEHSKRESKGSVNPYVNFSDLVWYEFALPPLEEQVRIARALLAAAQAVDAAIDLGLQGVRTRDAVLGSLVTGGVGFDYRDSRTIYELPLPRGWRIVKIAELCTAPVTSGTTPRTGKTNEDTGHPFVRVQNLTFDGSFAFSDSPEYVTQEAFVQTASRHVFPGDILINIVGPPLGKVSVVPIGFPEALINQAIVRFRVSDRDLADIVTGTLISGWGKRWLHVHSTKTSGQRNINVTTASALPVAVPDNLTLPVLAESIRSALAIPHSIIRHRTSAQQLYRDMLCANMEQERGRV